MSDSSFPEPPVTPTELLDYVQWMRGGAAWFKKKIAADKRPMPDGLKDLILWFVDSMDISLKAVHATVRKATVIARNAERDDEIIRLHDDEGKSFGQIGKLLILKNPKWCAKGGKQLTRKTVEKAYHRRKYMATN
jgi:hypothetical protein